MPTAITEPEHYDPAHTYISAPAALKADVLDCLITSAQPISAYLVALNVGAIGHSAEAVALVDAALLEMRTEGLIHDDWYEDLGQRWSAPTERIIDDVARRLSTILADPQHHQPLTLDDIRKQLPHGQGTPDIMLAAWERLTTQGEARQTNHPDGTPAWDKAGDSAQCLF